MIPGKLTFGQRTRGNALLEFALAFLILWLIFSGVFQFGYTFYIYNALETAVANASQYGSRLEYDTSNASSYTTALQNMVVYGDVTAGARPAVANLTASNVAVSVNKDSQGIPASVTVDISGYTIDGLFQRFTLAHKPQVTVKYVGRVICSGC